MRRVERRVTRALVEGGVIIAGTLVIAFYLTDEPKDLLPADVTVTEPVVKGTTQVQLLIKGAGCSPDDKPGRRAKAVRKRVAEPDLRYTSDEIVVTVKVHDPGEDKCTGPDPGVPYTLTLPTPLGTRILMDGTETPPKPFDLP